MHSIYRPDLLDKNKNLKSLKKTNVTISDINNSCNSGILLFFSLEQEILLYTAWQDIYMSGRVMKYLQSKWSE